MKTYEPGGPDHLEGIYSASVPGYAMAAIFYPIDSGEAQKGRHRVYLLTR